jgi:hypothetical protein
MERYPGDDPDLAEEELFADPDEVDFSMEDELDDDRLLPAQDDDEDY